MDTFLKDLKYGARTLARTPLFTAIAVACLALYPIRRWRQAHHRYEPDDTDDA